MSRSPLLSNDLISTEKVECGIIYAVLLGTSLLVFYKIFGDTAKNKGGRVHKVMVEFQRKSFHMIGGSGIGAIYHWGIKLGYLTSAFDSCVADPPVAGGGGLKTPLDGGAAFGAACLMVWIVAFIRLQVPAVNTFFLTYGKGLIRDKEINKATGVSYFIPGNLAAMMAAPSNIAVLGILFLSVGDAAASIGTAGGFVPVGSSPRKVEGSIGCFCVCAAISIWMGLATNVAYVTAGFVTLGEILAEVIGVDDNLVIPMMGVIGVRVGLHPQFGLMAAFIGMAVLGCSVLGAVVGAATVAKSKES